MVFSNVVEMVEWLLIGWAIWPGTFFLVAIIGESRVPPLWRHQSRAFFPGDLTLPIMWIAIIRINASEGLTISPTTTNICLIIMAFIVVIVFSIVTKVVMEDRNNYPLRAANSPTKIYHDLVGYYFFPLSIIPSVVFYVAGHIENNVAINWVPLLWIFLPLSFYILCVLCDVIMGATMEDMEARHPVNWVPIWRH